MSSVIFNSYKSLYNYYYEVGKDWTSPNQAMPEKGYACLIKMENNDKVPYFVNGFFGENGWQDHYGNKLKQDFSTSIVEWKYDIAWKVYPHPNRCNIL